jgi:branched-chain amino acid transport system permease protein
MLYPANARPTTRYGAGRQLRTIVDERIAFGLLLAAAFIGVPVLCSDYALQAILIPFVILSLAAIGLNLLVGYAGQISLGTGAFMAAGAYAAFNLHVRLAGLPLIASLLLGGLAAAAAGLLFGLPSLRIRGIHLAVATLAAQFFGDFAWLRIGWLTHHSASGSVGVSHLQAFGVPLDAPLARYFFCLAFLLAFALLAGRLVRGAIGREWRAVRELDIAAAAVGIRPAHAKLTAFALSSFIIGVAGGLWAFIHLGSWEPGAFGIDRSFQLLFMIIIGGLGSIAGSVLGAAFMVALPIVLEALPARLGLPLGSALASNLSSIAFGALIVFFLAVEPRGMSRLAFAAREKLRRRLFAH